MLTVLWADKGRALDLFRISPPLVNSLTLSLSLSLSFSLSLLFSPSLSHSFFIFHFQPKVQNPNHPQIRDRRRGVRDPQHGHRRGLHHPDHLVRGHPSVDLHPGGLHRHHGGVLDGHGGRGAAPAEDHLRLLRLVLSDGCLVTLV